MTAATSVALDAMTVFQALDVTYDASDNKTENVLSGTPGAESVVQHSYDSKNWIECAAARMNPATWAALPASACTLATIQVLKPTLRVVSNVSAFRGNTRFGRNGWH